MTKPTCNRSPSENTRVSEDPDTKEAHVEVLESNENETIEFPEGGLRAWLVVLGVWCSQFASLAYSNAHGVFHDYYVREYLTEYTSSEISWIGSVQLLLTLSAGLLTGRAFDLGYFYHLMITGSVLFVVCFFMLSLSHAGQFYQVFLTQGVGFGIAAGLTWVPGMGVIAQYFHRRRAIAMGIAATGSVIGAAVHPIILNHFFSGPIGFHNGLRISGAISAVLLFLSLFLIRPRSLPSSKKPGGAFASFKQFLSEPAYLSMTVSMFLLLTSLYFPVFFLQLKAIKSGLSTGFAFYTLVILNFSNTVARVVPNILVPYLGVFNLMIFSMISMGVLIFCMGAINTVAATVVFAILFGFFAGAYGGLVTPMIATLAQSNSEMGSRIGLCFTIMGFGGLIGTPISGALLATSYDWWKPQLFSGLCMLCGAASLVISRQIISRRKGSFWV